MRKVIWLDQPVGTGYSYVGQLNETVTNELEVAEGIYTFLQRFFQLYPQYQSLPFFIFGESYGGHYVPSISYYIVQMNSNLPSGLFIHFIKI